ncbi:MAG TPA: protein-glutamate O-methyltransferase CheR [Tepidisphaeraceae bacterium]|jgi:chemotaxis protein methyltransferase CheR
MAMNPNDLKYVCDLVLRRSGIVLDASKEYLIEARLSMLIKRLNVPSIVELLQQARTKKTEPAERDIVDAMTTNETSFFRDIHPFEALKKQIMPSLLASRAAERKLNIWCAASSTGQEPYTLAMLLKENFPQLAGWKVTFIASDLSRDVLAKAKAGRYSQLEVNRGLPAAMMVKYFKKQGLEWEIVPDVRNMIDFREINLLGAWPLMPSLDLVFIRNVLIYFNQETKRQILGRIRGLMRPDGFLFLGAAETTLNVDDKFERHPLENTGCYRLQSRAVAAAA